MYSVAEYLTDMQFSESDEIYCIKMQDYLTDRLGLMQSSTMDFPQSGGAAQPKVEYLEPVQKFSKDKAQ